MKTNKMLKEDVVNQFIIEISLLKPVKKIIEDLEAGNFRDCDINWLDNKLENFIEFTGSTLNIKGVMSQRESVKPKYINSYAVEYYLKYFKQLLDYFKSF